MSEEEYRKIFVKKLRYYMEAAGKNQNDIVRALGYRASTVSDWCTGKKLPRMDKIQALADYFGIEKSDLIEDNEDSTPSYYLNDDAREAAEWLHKNPDYKVLFDASRKVKKEDIDFVKQMIERMAGDFDD